MAKNGYPDNVYVHGNGFVQIDLGGQPEHRIHIWTRGLFQQAQNVNTQIHDHRFGFVSSVVKGALVNQSIEPFPDANGRYRKWQAEGERAETGQRRLVPVGGLHSIMPLGPDHVVAAGNIYAMPPKMFHRSIPLTPFVVTLMSKSAVIPTEEFQASVMCEAAKEPDQTWDRRSIPWMQLLSEHITPALAGTPYDIQDPAVDIFRFTERNMAIRAGTSAEFLGYEPGNEFPQPKEAM